MLKIKRIYIFDYGGPIVFMEFNEDSVIFHPLLDSKNKIYGMATVAFMIKKFQDRKFFTTSRYVGFMGKNFIGVAEILDKKFAVFVLGFLRRLILYLESNEVELYYTVESLLEKTKKFLISMSQSVTIKNI